MKRPTFRRIGALVLGLVLVTGLQAKAYGLAFCPMHQAAQKDAHQGHHGHHAGSGDATAVCNCVDACQSGCSSAIVKAGAPRLVLVSTETSHCQGSAPVSALPALRAHLLPFATAPPSLD
jgi:hypothetical protein